MVFNCDIDVYIYLISEGCLITKNPCLNDLKWLKKCVKTVKTVRPSLIYFSILRTEGLENIQQVNHLLSQYGGKRGKTVCNISKILEL